MLQPYSIANEDLTTPAGRARLELLLETLFANVGTTTGGSAGVVFYSTTAPTSPTSGMIWCKTGATVPMRWYDPVIAKWRSLMTGGIVT